MESLNIFIRSIFIDNMVFAFFFGMCSYIAVSKSVKTALGLGLPTAVTWHCVIDGSAPVHRALGYAARWAERGAALSAVSAMAADRVHRIVPPQTRVSVLPNGIDVARWRRPEGLADVPVPPLRIVAAQRMVRRKRPDALIDLLLRDFEELTIEEMAQRLGIGMGDIVALVERAQEVFVHPMGLFVAGRMLGSLSFKSFALINWVV